MKLKVVIGVVVALALAGVLLVLRAPRGGGESAVRLVVDDPAQAHTLALPGRVSVEVPPDTLARGAALNIRELSERRPHDFAGFLPAGLYEINVEGQQEFGNELTLRFDYDKSRLESGLGPAAQLAVAFFDGEFGRWREVDFSLSPGADSVEVRTNHLSLWSIFVKDEKYFVASTPNFTIYANKDAKAPRIGPITSGDALYEYVTAIRTGLYDIYKVFADAGYKVPAHTRVYVEEGGSKTEAEWGWFSKNINIPTNYISEQEMRLVASHEFFHAIQNQYVYFLSMHLDRWWIEATADYAAAHIATGYGLKDPLTYAYFKQGITSSEGFHAYQTAHFIKYLVDSGLDFKDMFVTVTGSSGRALPNLAAYCQTKGSPLPELYMNFVRDAVFSANVATAYDGADIYGGLATYRLEYEIGKTPQVVQLMDIGAEYAATLAGVKLSCPGSKKEGEILIKAIEPTSGARVRYVLCDTAGRGSIVAAGELAHEPLTLQVKDGQYLYFLAANIAPAAGYVTVVVGEPEQKPEPYENRRTAEIYNRKFLVDVELKFTSSQPYQISQELINQDTLLVQIDIKRSKNPLVINAEAVLKNLRFREKEAWNPAAVPVIREMYWETREGQVADSKTTLVIPADDERGLRSIGYSLVIDIKNTSEQTTNWGGGSSVVLLRVRIMD